MKGLILLPRKDHLVYLYFSNSEKKLLPSYRRQPLMVYKTYFSLEANISR